MPTKKKKPLQKAATQETMEAMGLSDRTVDVRDAALAAKKFFEDIAASSVTILTLEEVERSGDNWLITLSYLDADRKGAFLESLTPVRYKVFEVDGTTGEVLSMKMRDTR